MRNYPLGLSLAGLGTLGEEDAYGYQWQNGGAFLEDTYVPRDPLPLDQPGGPVVLAPVALPQINVPESIANPAAATVSISRPGGEYSTIQTPLPAPQTNNWWLTTTNTIGPGYVAPVDQVAPAFSVGPAYEPGVPNAALDVNVPRAGASISVSLPPANVTTLPVQSNDSGAYAPSWIGTGGGGGVFIPDSGGGGSAPQQAASNSKSAALLAGLALLAVLMQ